VPTRPKTPERRLAFPRSELRTRTVRGTLVTAAFLVAIDALVIAQGLVVTRLLGPSLIGLYGIVTVTVMTIVALKRVGIDEAYVQQDEAGQEEEFQRAFTLDLAFSALIAVALCVLAPVVAAAYGEERLLGLMLAMAWLPLALALQAPLWVFFRRMEYGRQRTLQAIQPVVTFAVTVPLAATGFGVYSLVVGSLAGYVAAVGAALVASPYRLRLRFEGAAARRYLAFSKWIVVATVATLVIQQGQTFAFEQVSGLEWAGFLTLAVMVTRYVDRADQIVTSAIYPAVCAVRGTPGGTRTLEELFVSSNRATLLWVTPFTVGLILFAPDLVDLVLGDEWEPAVLLIQGLAAAGLLQHLGFNWFSFYRAHGDTRPPALEALTGGAAFLAFAIPGLALAGAGGFVAGRIASVAVALLVRARYVRRLLPHVRLGQLVGGALPAAALATASALGVRLALWGGERGAGQAVAELVVFLGVFGTVGLLRERALVGELRGALARSQDDAGEHDGDERQSGHLPVPVDR
jgi:O-antigen/teichoic acid export membrane protein